MVLTYFVQRAADVWADIPRISGFPGLPSETQEMIFALIALGPRVPRIAFGPIRALKHPVLEHFKLSSCLGCLS